MVAKVGKVAYRLDLSQVLSRIHSTFHVSRLQKCLTNDTTMVPLNEIQVDDQLNYVEIGG